MKTIKKIGYGLLSLVTLFFYTVTNGFPRNRIFSSIKEKVQKIQKNSSNAPESLILEQPDTPYDDAFVSHTSHRSHSSHGSHASHRSGTTGTVRTAPVKKTTPATTAVYANPYVQYLTVADVERITGLSGVQQNVEPAVLHFLRSDGKGILQVKFWAKTYFDNFKNNSKCSPITGIGEAALVSTSQLPSELIFILGTHCVEISTFPMEGLRLFLSLDQLKIVATYISSRLTYN